MSPKSRFLIACNGRTGSSWLLTSLDRLPDVRARQEIKWSDDSIVIRPDVHQIVDRNGSMSGAIEAAVGADAGSEIIGSKLVFNPYKFHGPGVFDGLASIIEPDIRLILLRRNYLDTWLSWKARGVYHEIDDDVTSDLDANPMIEAMRKLDAPPILELALHHDGGPMADAPGRPYPLITAIDDMLQCFSNDIQVLVIARERPHARVDYPSIGADLGRLASFVGSTATSAETSAIANRPQTRKLASLDHCIQPAEPLSQLAGILGQAYADAAAGKTDPTDLWRWRDAETAEIADESIVAALSRYFPANSGCAIEWRVQKPVVAC